MTILVRSVGHTIATRNVQFRLKRFTRRKLFAHNTTHIHSLNAIFMPTKQKSDLYSTLYNTFCHSPRNLGEAGAKNNTARDGKGGGGRRQLRNMTLPGSEKKRRMDGRLPSFLPLSEDGRRRLKI